MLILNTFRARQQVRRRLPDLRARLYRSAYAWCHDRALADDLVQETLARALENAPQLRDAGALDAWVFAILANCHRSYLRRAGRSGEEAPAHEPAADERLGPEHVTDRHALLQRVREALARLSHEQRTVLTLVDLEGFSYAEVAMIAEVPVGTVMSRLSRARARLKTLLGAARVRPAPVTLIESRR